KLCDSRLSQKRLASVFHTVSRAACPPRSPGAKKAPTGACDTNLSGRADPRALTRKVAGCLELKMMAPPQKLCDSRPYQKWLASVFHTVSRAACPPRSPGAKKAPAGACDTNLSGRADPRALTRQ
ncbi:mCG1036820, partial [Mus musculus]